VNPRAYFNERVRPRLTADRVYGALDLRWRDGEGRGPCPLHGGDNPGSFKVWEDQLNWICFTKCEEVNGRRSGGPVEFIMLSRGVSERDAVALLAKLAEGQPVRAAPVRQGRPPAPREPLPAEEVRAVWDSAGPVTKDPEAVAWLERFKLDPRTIVKLDLARVLPFGARVPTWAARWVKKGPSGFGPMPSWRLVFPAYDTRGRLASLRARTLVHPAPVGRNGKAEKELAPDGTNTAAGFILADERGRRLLAGDPAATKRVRRLGLLIAEGTKDLLTVATEKGAPPVLSIYAGSWTNEHAERIPAGSTVIVATHSDDGGDKYADTIWQTLHARCELTRRHY